jgi:hypothetical protein
VSPSFQNRNVPSLSLISLDARSMAEELQGYPL